MKYITTDKHPELKEGLICDSPGDFLVFKLVNGNHSIGKDALKDWIEKGYIKEVEEKEYTKSDMINFGQYYGNHTQGLETAFNEYLKIRG